MDTMTPQPPADWRAPQQPELNHKQLKALAKASRPWYAKKRTWLGGFFGLCIVGAMISAAGSGGNSTGTKQNGGVSTLSNNGKNPPQADVTLSSCSVDGLTNWPEAELRITNHSSERSDYMISINFLDSSGTKLADGTVISNNIEPGQSAVESTSGLKSWPKGAAISCSVTDVNRFASH